MSAIPYMPLWVSDYLADTQDFSTEEHGAYMLLIMTYWQRGEPLPNDPERLARVARLSNERWTSVEPTLKRMFNVTANEWMHKRIDAELTRARNKIEKARESGKKSAKSRKANPEPTDVERPLPPSPNPETTTSESDSLLSTITVQSTEQGPAREAPAPKKAEQILDIGSKVKLGAKALASFKPTALDRLKVQAEKFGLDADDIAEKTAKRNATNPAGYFISLSVNQLQSKLPFIAEKVLTAAMRGEGLAVSTVYQALSEPAQ